MKRDLDLCRQLLLDLEANGPDCSVSNLCIGPIREVEQRIQYHLRLLIEAGLVAESDRPQGAALLRLTHAGAELVELIRDEVRWTEAKSEVLERTGGLSLAVLRAVLTKWSVEAAMRRTHGNAVPRRRSRPYVHGAYPMVHPSVYQRPVHGDGYWYDDRTPRPAAYGPDYRERSDGYRPAYSQQVPGNVWPAESGVAEDALGLSLPIYIV